MKPAALFTLLACTLGAVEIHDEAGILTPADEARLEQHLVPAEQQLGRTVILHTRTDGQLVAGSFLTLSPSRMQRETGEIPAEAARLMQQQRFVDAVLAVLWQDLTAAGLEPGFESPRADVRDRTWPVVLAVLVIAAIWRLRIRRKSSCS